MTHMEALELALKKEDASIKLYQNLLNNHKPIRELLTFLLNEEFKHKKMIKNRIYELNR